jgi:1,4-dihydroxy-2-naphthoate octaprenyltransferase
MAQIIKSIIVQFFENYQEYEKIIDDIHDTTDKSYKIVQKKKVEKTIKEMILEIPDITPLEAYYLERKMEFIFKENLYVIQEE